MCFSPTASFTAGIVISAVGCATIAKTKRASEVPFATIPLLFGVQQLTEGVIWLSIGSSAVLTSMMTFIYLLFSHIVWPIYLPVSVYVMERSRWRRWVLGAFIALGFVVGFYFLYYLVTERVQAEVVGGCIAYTSLHFFKTFVLSPYTAAACVSCLFSGHRTTQIFGVLTFLAAVFTFQFYQYAFVSVWCFFSAILSILIYLHFHSARR